MGLNAKVEVTLGKSTSVVELPSMAPSIGSVGYQPAVAASEILIKVLTVHSEKDNGFQRIHVWTKGKHLKHVINLMKS